MDNFIMLFAILANIIAILLVYYSFGRKMDKQKKFMNTLIGIGFICIVVWLIFTLSSIGIEKISASEKVKTLLTIAFVPVNAILFIPYSVTSFLKSKEKKISLSTFNKRMIIIAIIAVFVLIGEFFYFRSFQLKIIELNKQIESNKDENQEIDLNNNTSNNQIDNENITNEINENNVIENNEIGNIENKMLNSVSNNIE